MYTQIYKCTSQLTAQHVVVTHNVPNDNNSFICKKICENNYEREIRTHAIRTKLGQIEAALLVWRRQQKLSTLRKIKQE